MKIVLGIIAIVIIGGAVIYGVYGKNLNNQISNKNQEINKQNQEQKQIVDNNQKTEDINPSGAYSINELLTMNKPMKCTWKESASNKGEVTNIIYLNGKKIYQDVTMNDLGHSFMISDGDYLYIWNDFNDTASKMKYSDIKTDLQPEQGKTTDSAGLDQKRDFVCENWTVDESVFIPPQDKNFSPNLGHLVL